MNCKNCKHSLAQHRNHGKDGCLVMHCRCKAYQKFGAKEVAPKKADKVGVIAPDKTAVLELFTQLTTLCKDNPTILQDADVSKLFKKLVKLSGIDKPVKVPKVAKPKAPKASKPAAPEAPEAPADQTEPKE